MARVLASTCSCSDAFATVKDATVSMCEEFLWKLRLVAPRRWSSAEMTPSQILYVPLGTVQQLLLDF